MKVSYSTAPLFAGLSLTAGLFCACDLNNPGRGSAADNQPVELRLSIKDDPGCLEKWDAIQLSRIDGKGEGISEADFLANCMKEIKDGAVKVPSDLVPDSASRCHWIEVKFDGGRKDLETAYKQYCAGDVGAVEGKPDFVEGKPDLIKEKPLYTEDVPAPTEPKPELLKEKLAQIGETAPAKIQEKPEHIDDKPILDTTPFVK